jgi:hypothetical protein
VEGLRFKRLEGFTHILDAVYDAATLFLSLDNDQERRRRAILIFTDNANQRGVHSATASRDRLWEANATLNGMITHSRGPFGNRRPLLGGGVSKLAKLTGGEVTEAGDVEFEFPEMMRRIRNCYSLYYRLPERATGGSIRQVRVELSSRASRRFPGARVLARQGYREGTQRNKALIARP